ncbi:MAG: AraC family transcriptional regulator [Bacteroidota bacterium]
MKIQLEHIHPDANSSFRLLQNPRLNDLFYWHFHPEYELVYIEGANATRHVGTHISRFEQSDLVFIGSNIPHLNFDYGVQTDYQKVVLHIQATFKEDLLHRIPELHAIFKLFEQAAYGLAFSGETKKRVGERLLFFHQLSPFEQFLEAMNIFQILAMSQEVELLHEQVHVNKYSRRAQERIKLVYRFVEENYQRHIEVNEIASICNLSKAAFCRYFKKMSTQTFVSFLNQYRIGQSKKLLLQGKNVTEAAYASGFESLSYFNRLFKKIVGENPSNFRRNHRL